MKTRLIKNLIGLKTIFVNEAIRFTRIWPQTLLPSAMTMALYFIIFGNFLGSKIGTINHYSYIQHLTPGLIMMAIITNSYNNVASSFFSIRFQKSVEELIVSPMPNSLILIGFIAGGIARGLIVGILVTLTSLFFTILNIHNIGMILFVAFFTASLFSLAGFTNALLAKKFDDVSIIPTFILTPLTYLGGVFYSIDQLPELWRHVSKLNPILYMVSAFRYGFLGTSDVPIQLALGIIITATLALFWLNIILLNKGVGIRT